MFYEYVNDDLKSSWTDICNMYDHHLFMDNLYECVVFVLVYPDSINGF